MSDFDWIMYNKKFYPRITPVLPYSELTTHVFHIISNVFGRAVQHYFTTLLECCYPLTCSMISDITLKGKFRTNAFDLTRILINKSNCTLYNILINVTKMMDCGHSYKGTHNICLQNNLNQTVKCIKLT